MRRARDFSSSVRTHIGLRIFDMLIHRKKQKLWQLAAVAGFTIAAGLAQAVEKPTVAPGEPQKN